MIELVKHWFIFIVLISTLIGCKKTPPASSEQPAGVKKEDKGNWVSEQRYENPSFGIFFEAPTGWFLKKNKDLEAIQRALKTIKDASDEVKYAVPSHYNPFWVYKQKPTEGSLPINASLQANPVPIKLNGLSTNQIAMEQRKELAEVIHLSYPNPVETMTLNGLEVCKQTLRSDLPNEVKIQQQYFMQKNGFLIIYAITYPEATDLKDIHLLEKAIGAL